MWCAAQDLFWSTSVHRLLQALLDLPAPIYRHHRLILDADGRKLSKSTQATGLRELRAQGRDARGYPQDGRALGLTVAPPSAGHAHAAGRPEAGGSHAESQAQEACPGAQGAPAPAVVARAAARAIEIALAGLRARHPHAADRHSGAGGSAARLRSARARAALGGRDQGRGRSSGAADHDRGRRGQGGKPRAWCCARSRSRRASWRNRSPARSPRAPRPRGSRSKSRLPTICPSACSGDAVRLRSALENLIDNAVKFTERGSIGFAASAAPRGRRTRAADVHRHRQRHRHHRGRSQAAVPAVRAGERGGGAPLRRRRPRPRLRQAHRRGDGRRPRR